MTRHRAGFTLVEMVVAIGLIVILTALTVTASVVLVRKSEERQTENLLKLLDMALHEWETTGDKRLTWGSGADADMKAATPHVFTLSEVLDRIGQSESGRAIIAQIQPEFLYAYDSTGPVVPPWLPAVPDPDDPDANSGNARSSYTNGDWDGSLAVLDAWGTPIRAVHAGPRFLENVHDPAIFVNSDGTWYLSTNATALGAGVEEYYGACENRRMRFISAGPDGKFGNLHAPHGSAQHDQLHDNVRSYIVEDFH